MSNSDLVHSWRHFLERYHSTTCALERALNDEHQLGMSEFEVLDRLAEGEAAGTCAGAAKRVQELATSLHLSQSALSRVIARLERDGLVMRGMCSNDRRGIYVGLTDEGRSRHARALPTQRSVLAAEFGAQFAAPAVAASGKQASAASRTSSSPKPGSEEKPTKPNEPKTKAGAKSGTTSRTTPGAKSGARARAHATVR